MSTTPVTATNTNYTITGDDIPHSFKQGMAEIDLIARAEKAEARLAFLIENGDAFIEEDRGLGPMWGASIAAIDAAMKEGIK